MIEIIFLKVFKEKVYIYMLYNYVIISHHTQPWQILRIAKYPP